MLAAAVALPPSLVFVGLARMLGSAPHQALGVALQITVCLAALAVGVTAPGTMRLGLASLLGVESLAASALAWRQLGAPPADSSPAAVSAAPATLGATAAPGDAEEAG